jgi:serine/threonine-protein kinase
MGEQRAREFPPTRVELRAAALGGGVPTDDPSAQRYEDLGAIGRGGMGDVRRVFDRHFERVLAMKILAPELVDDEASRERFLAEAKITATLQHPGIVAVHDHGCFADGRLWMTMREVRGRTLSEVIDELHDGIAHGAWPSSGLTLHRVVDSFRRMCDAVAYAHSVGVVHRDLKPSNLMVGEFGEVQVMDWGLAKHVSGGRDSRPDEGGAITRVGDIVGTPTYMAPEQARGDHGSVGPRSDVWALGAVLRTILTNQLPVLGPSHAVLAMILLNEVKPIAQVIPPGHPPLPPELVAICERAMSHRAEDRFADAGEVADEVGAWLEGARRRERALEIVEQARTLEPGIVELRERAAKLHREARGLLDVLPQGTPAEEKHAGWSKEDEARELERAASLRQLEWLQRMRSALEVVPELPEAHARLAEHYRAELEDAEASRDAGRAMQAEALLRAHDRGQHATFLAGDGAVTLLTDPPGARVTLHRYVERHRRLVPERVRELGRTPIVAEPLAHGSYVLEVEHEGRPVVRYPVFVERGAHWDGVPPGAREPVPIRIPTAEELGDDLVYVPPGWFWSGGDALAVESLPRRRVWVDGLLVGRHPVTNAEYIAFLDRLVARGDEASALRFAPRSPQGHDRERADRLAFERDASRGFVLPIDENGLAWQPDWPVSLIDWHAAMAFAAARSRPGQHAFRLPDELEWEKLARGVDGRLYPWGDHGEPTWACIIGSAPSGAIPGRVSVHAHPIDESPFGIRGTTGNVREWCANVWRPEGPSVRDGKLAVEIADASDDALRAARGGAWHAVPELARPAGRFAGEPHRRFSVLGFRVVRPYP